ncbi:glycosyltransferase family 39 protein [Flavobacterium psychrotrophum]|uniref:glycosyltransferase family 39 protein n=1 Tax=Flavobacterium psychrotrophum TaxID=2294119 RepID=UPI000E32022C|nr:glycosyltransferase family 39 protein [Flavobacterium psychrotrophum]
MNKIILKLRNRDTQILTVIMVLAVFLRFFRLDFQSLWMDEIYTLLITDPSKGLKEFVSSIEATEGFPYMYYFVLRGFYAILGYSSLVARIPSAIAGVAAVYVVYLFVKHIYNKNAGLIAALLLAVNEFHIHFSQEARSYSIYAFLVLLSFYRLSVLIKQLSLKNTLWYALSVALVLNISFFGAINIVSQFFILALVFAYAPKEERKQIFSYGAITAAIALVSFLPNYRILKNMMAIKSFWLGPPQPDSLKNMFYIFLGEFEITIFIFSTLIIYYFFCVFKKQDTPATTNTFSANKDRYSFTLLISWFAIFIAGMYLKSYTGTSVVLDRYFISIMPVAVIVIAIAIAKISGKMVRTAIVVSIFTFTLLNILYIKKVYTSVYKSQYREVATYILHNNKAHDPVYTSLAQMYSYYLKVKDKTTDLRDSNLDNLLTTMAADTTKIKSFWYADAHVRPFNITDANKEFLSKYFTLEDNFEGFDAWSHHYILNTAENKELSPEKIAAIKQSKVEMAYNFDEFNQNGAEISVSGWAYLPDQDATNSRINVLLVKENRTIKMQTIQVVRKDVTADRKSFDFDNSGFRYVGIPKNVPAGTYQVGIYILDKATNKESVVVTDKTIEVQ